MFSGTHTLLECAKNFGIRKFIHVSTDEVVGEDTVGIPMDENSKKSESINLMLQQKLEPNYL